VAKKNKYTDWSKEDLIKRIGALEKRKKYGLVWDEEHTKERFEAATEGKLPVLKEVMTKEVKSNSSDPKHILIEGDNYHSLSVLNYTHERAFDVIYIDPPFNTGNKSWRYNNDYVEKEDAFRHSKWLSFMSKRLKLTKSLLSSKGVIVVAIDDYEHHTLRLMMDEMYGEENRLGTIIVVHNPRGRNDDKYFATMHEYMLVYAKNKDKVSVRHFELDEDEKDKYSKVDDISAYNEASYMRTGNNSDRSTRPNLFYPIYYNPKTDELSLVSGRGFLKLLPINEAGEEKTWRWGQETFDELHSTELFVKLVKGKYRIFKKRRLTNLPGRKPKTVWYNPRYDASSYGIMVLRNIIGKENEFPYPKSIYTMYDILHLLTQKDSMILDFFAGSGTTGHAILKLNKKDDGLRRFVLCTDNENGICEDICYPRISNIIKGYKNSKGVAVPALKGGLKYYKTSFVPAVSTDKYKEALTKEAIEMLCLREYTFEFVLGSESFKIYRNMTHYTGIVLNQLSIPNFKKTIRNYDKPIHVYIFSLGDDDFADEFNDMKKIVKVCPIPEAILRVYRRIFK
jgi:adenine-specific DNA-methyltransferase